MKTPWARKPDTTTDDAPEVAELRRRLRETRAKLRANREKLHAVRDERNALSAQRKKDRDELAALRAWSLDVFPGRDLPDRVSEVIEGVRREKLTFLGVNHLRSLAACVRDVEESGREGILIEAGTALGGSAIVLAAAADAQRELRVYDVFGLIPPPGEEDGEDVHQRYQTIADGQAKGRQGDTYYGYHDDLLAEVTESFARHGLPVEESNVTLVKGLFADTITGDEPVALAHVDGDWYESTLTCLERIAPRLVPGGRIVIDDYYHWSGCRTAVDEYFAGRPGYRIEMRAKVHVVREE